MLYKRHQKTVLTMDTNNIPKDLIKGVFIGASTTTTLLIAFMLYKRHQSKKEREEISDDDENSSDDEQDSTLPESILDVAPKDWGVLHAPFKMLLCVNQELYDENGKSKKMSSGKVAAQCCHATLGAYKRGLRKSPGAVRAWEYTGQAKIAVKCPTEKELIELRNAAAARGISTYLVVDAGRTQIAPNSKTVLAIGPAPVATFEDFTKHLKLY
mmetsp:Transcript_9759/g.12821  ORF Transcript_9759/g.12821 Transcript_9759/m.12821 type:complete len:213 (+) Transcript_9759:1-639(+)